MNVTLPSDLEAEKAVLACVMADPAAFDEANLPPAMFHDPKHRMSWEAIARLSERSDPIDPLTVADEVEAVTSDARGNIRSHLTDILVNFATSPATVAHYAGIVRRNWVTRQAGLAAGAMIARIEQGELGTELVSDAISDLAKIESEQADSAMAVDALARWRGRELFEEKHGNKQRGFPTGVAKLDELLGGIQPGIVTIAAGRPGMGKSALAMGVAKANAEQGTGVHVFSLEDTRAAYGDRVLARYSEIAAEDIRTGAAFEKRGLWEKLKAAIEGLNRSRLPWLVDDRSGIDAAEVVRSVRRNMRANGTRVVVVDYVQLLKRKPGVSMHEHMGEQTTILADAAKRDSMAYLVLSQLNRGLEHRDDKRPKMSDLRESGSLEERAKAVLALYRAAVYEPEADESEMEILVLKNSQGRTGYAEVRWNGPTTTIS